MGPLLLLSLFSYDSFIPLNNQNYCAIEDRGFEKCSEKDTELMLSAFPPERLNQKIQGYLNCKLCSPRNKPEKDDYYGQYLKLSEEKLSKSCTSLALNTLAPTIADFMKSGASYVAEQVPKIPGAVAKVMRFLQNPTVLPAIYKEFQALEKELRTMLSSRIGDEETHQVYRETLIDYLKKYQMDKKGSEEKYSKTALDVDRLMEKFLQRLEAGDSLVDLLFRNSDKKTNFVMQQIFVNSLEMQVGMSVNALKEMIKKFKPLAALPGFACLPKEHQLFLVCQNLPEIGAKALAIFLRSDKGLASVLQSRKLQNAIRKGIGAGKLSINERVKSLKYKLEFRKLSQNPLESGIVKKTALVTNYNGLNRLDDGEYLFLHLNRKGKNYVYTVPREINNPKISKALLEDIKNLPDDLDSPEAKAVFARLQKKYPSEDLKMMNTHRTALSHLEKDLKLSTMEGILLKEAIEAKDHNKLAQLFKNQNTTIVAGGEFFGC